MKKRICFVLVLSLLLSYLVFPAGATDVNALPEICEHCGVAVTWTPLSQAEIRSTNSLTTGHYYVAMEEEISDSVVKSVAADQTVCLYLNGKTLAGTTRALNIKAGGTLNIMGEGKITGRGTTAGVDGACCYIESGGTLNQYGGTLSYVTYQQRHAVNGGVVYVGGTYNLYNGIVENGITKVYHGGNIYVAANAAFNMYGGEVRNGTAEYAGGNMYVHPTGTFRHLGGTISGGTAKEAGDSVYNRGTVYLSGNAVCNSIFLKTDTAKGGPDLCDMVNVLDGFTGDVAVDVFETVGMDIGNAEVAQTAGTIRILNSMLIGQIQDGNILLVPSSYCDHCKKDVVWTPLTAEGDMLESGHYYAQADLTDFEQKNIYVGGAVCVNLNGKTLTAATRAFSVYPSGELSIMGSGTVYGRGGAEKTPNGGAISVVKDGVCNLYGGTLAYMASEETGIKAPSNGGILNIAGTFNMFGGTIEGGVATNAGGSVFVEPTGTLNVSGGTILMGKMGANSSNSCIYNRGTLVLSGAPNVTQILQKPNTADGGPALGDMLVIRDTFTGQVDVRASGLVVGMDLGNMENGDFKDASIKINGSTAWKFSLLGNDLLAAKGEAVILFAADGSKTGFATLAEAVAASAGTADRIVLFADNDENITLTKDISLDLNGCAFTGIITGGYAVFCTDTATDDYTVADGICGSVLAGNSHVQPAEGYIMLEENGAFTFHKLTFDITAINLRLRENGVYFTAEFAGDEMVSSRVESFGIALNAYEIPSQENMETTSLYSAYRSDRWVSGKKTAATGTLLRGILDKENGDALNAIHAATQVFGRAYIKTAEGYQFAQTRAVDLKSLLEITDAGWQSMSQLQKNSVLAMYNEFGTVMESWQLPNLKQEKQDFDRYALVEKTAEESDIAALEMIYSGTQAYHGELHDHAATGGTSDGKQPLVVWKAYMNELNMDFAAIVDHRQVLHMRHEDWDNTIFIGGSEASTTITDREGVKLHYNMTFARPEGLEIVLHQFPEFNFRIWSESDRAGCGGQMHFNYPSFTAARFSELCEAVYANGGFMSIVHPKAPGYVDSEDPADAWFADYTGVEVFYTPNMSRDNKYSRANYELWTGMLGVGKKVFATAGNDAHNMPSVEALSTIYSAEKDSQAYIELLRTGNFTAGPVGIRMAVGDTAMGGTVSFKDNRLVLSVADFHESVYDPNHSYRVDLISDEGIVFSQYISCEDTAYFAVDTQDVMFYRVEVWDTTLNSLLAIGNPIWNSDIN